MNRPLIIVGASIRAAAQSAVAAGFDVLGADLFGDVDTESLTKDMRRVRPWPAALPAAVRDFPNCPWLYTGALENYPEIVAELAAQRPLLGNDASVLQRARDPILLPEVLSQAGLPFAATSTVPRTGGKWLIKPRRGAGGNRVAFADGGPPAGDWYWQQFIEGEPASAIFVAAAGQARLLATSYQLTGEPALGSEGFTYVGSICPGPVCDRSLEDLGSILASEFRLSGLFGVDGVVQGNCFVPVEINPRYTASTEVAEAAFRVNFLNQHVAACQAGHLPESAASLTARGAYGKAIVFAKQQVRIDESWLETVRKMIAGDESLADLPRPQEVIECGRPILTVLCSGGDATEVRQCLEHMAEQVYASLAPTATG